MHAGLLPEHVRAGPAAGAGEAVETDAEGVMERMNKEACAWMLGEALIPESLWGENSPLWTRVYSSPDSRDIVEEAREQLEEVGVPRLLVHLPGATELW